MGLAWVCSLDLALVLDLVLGLASQLAQVSVVVLVWASVLALQKSQADLGLAGTSRSAL
jgi:hypothetical protein